MLVGGLQWAASSGRPVAGVRSSAVRSGRPVICGQWHAAMPIGGGREQGDYSKRRGVVGGGQGSCAECLHRCALFEAGLGPELRVLSIAGYPAVAQSAWSRLAVAHTRPAAGARGRLRPTFRVVAEAFGSLVARRWRDGWEFLVSPVGRRSVWCHCRTVGRVAVARNALATARINPVRLDCAGRRYATGVSGCAMGSAPGLVVGGAAS